MSVKRVLVTGGAGFIGARVVARLLAERPGIEVVILDKLSYAAATERLEELPSDGWRLVVGDVASPRDLRGALGDGVDGVIHLAAETHVDRSIDGPAPFVQTNVVGTFELLEALRAGAYRRLIHVSTDEVYGDQWVGEGGPAAADIHQGLKGSSPYAATKSAADLLVSAYRRTFGLDVVITRGSNTFGPWQQPEKLMPVALGHLASGRPAPLYGDGQHLRDWIYVDDHADAIIAALLHAASGRILHVGSGHLRTNRSVVDALAAGLRRRGFPVPDPPATSVADRPGHDRSYRLVLGELELAPGWSPRVGFDEGIERLLDFTLAHPEWWAQRGAPPPRWLGGSPPDGR